MKLVSEKDYLVLDDTTWQRFAKKAEAVSFVRDSRIGKAVFGMSVVMLVRTDGKRKVPLGISVWKKGRTLESRTGGGAAATSSRARAQF